MLPATLLLKRARRSLEGEVLSVKHKTEFLSLNLNLCFTTNCASFLCFIFMIAQISPQHSKVFAFQKKKENAFLNISRVSSSLFVTLNVVFTGFMRTH